MAKKTNTKRKIIALVSELTGHRTYVTRKNTMNTPDKLELLSLIDILVDGRYDKSKRNLMLQFRGSSNQRIIDVQKSLKSGQVVIWDKLNDGKESYEQVKRE